MVTLGLAQALEKHVAAWAEELQPTTPPRRLSHYTRFAGAEGIIRHRCLWATRLSKQTDAEEVNDAISLMSTIAQGKRCTDLPRMLFAALPEAMRQRRHWLFIVCFCEDDNSFHHWSNYGQYRFDVDVHDGKNLLLRPFVSGTDRWLRRCIYDRDEFAAVAEKAVTGVIEAVESHECDLQGPWLPKIAMDAAASVAESLLTIAVSLKRTQFAQDREYRLICAPRVNIASTAPKMADEAFFPLIKDAQLERGLVHYIDLYKGGGPRYPDETPYVAVTQSPSYRNASEVAKLDRILKSFGESVRVHHCEQQTG